MMMIIFLTILFINFFLYSLCLFYQNYSFCVTCHIILMSRLMKKWESWLFSVLKRY